MMLLMCTRRSTLRLIVETHSVNPSSPSVTPDKHFGRAPVPSTDNLGPPETKPQHCDGQNTFTALYRDKINENLKRPESSQRRQRSRKRLLDCSGATGESHHPQHELIELFTADITHPTQRRSDVTVPGAQ